MRPPGRWVGGEVSAEDQGEITHFASCSSNDKEGGWNQANYGMTLPTIRRGFSQFFSFLIYSLAAESGRQSSLS